MPLSRGVPVIREAAARVPALPNEALITLKMNVGDVGDVGVGTASSHPGFSVFQPRAKCGDAVKIRFASKGV